MQRGFTLVEMLVVLILLGLAAGLVAPALLPARHTDTSQFAALVAAGEKIFKDKGQCTTCHGIGRAGRGCHGSTRRCSVGRVHACHFSARQLCIRCPQRCCGAAHPARSAHL